MVALLLLDRSTYRLWVLSLFGERNQRQKNTGFIALCLRVYPFPGNLQISKGMFGVLFLEGGSFSLVRFRTEPDRFCLLGAYFGLGFMIVAVQTVKFIEKIIIAKIK